MPMIGDLEPILTDILKELKCIDEQIAENEICPKLKKQRVDLIQKILDKTRIELVLSAAELRRYRRPCEDCLRCGENTENL